MLDYTMVARLVRQLEILGEQLSRSSLQFFIGIDGCCDPVPKVVGTVVIRGVDAQVFETELIHLLGKDHGNGIGLLPHGAAGIPYPYPASTAGIADHVIGCVLQCRLIAHEKSKCHCCLSFGK